MNCRPAPRELEHVAATIRVLTSAGEMVERMEAVAVVERVANVVAMGVAQ